jgi:hypothetical protein
MYTGQAGSDMNSDGADALYQMPAKKLIKKKKKKTGESMSPGLKRLDTKGLDPKFANVS